MEENNRKGPGIFYAVVGVATLVVAIIGATFAYFTASANSAENDIRGSIAAAGGIELNITPLTTGTGTSMIPLNLIEGTSQFEDAMEGSCKDDNGNNVCQVYKIELTNKSTTAAVEVRGSLVITSEATNLKWQLINVGTNDDVTAASEISTGNAKLADAIAQNATGQLVRASVNATIGEDNNENNVARQKINASDSATYYVLIWLEETGSPQQGVDAGKDFTGEVNFNAVNETGATTGLTASFKA